MARRHLKKDDKNLQCGLPLTPKFLRNLAPDRISVTCGACELVSRPQIEKPVAVAVAAEWAGEEGEEEGAAPAEGAV